MKVRLIIVQYKCLYPGQFAPNVADAWDEYTLEDNYEGFEKAVAEHEARRGVDYERDGVKVLDVEVPTSAVEALFEVPTVKAQVSS
jgi:hypothetical protein